MSNDLDRRRGGALSRLKRSPLAASAVASLGVAAVMVMARPVTIGDLIVAPNIEVNLECSPVRDAESRRRCLNSWTLRVGDESQPSGDGVALLVAIDWADATGTSPAATMDSAGPTPFSAAWNHYGGGDTPPEVLDTASARVLSGCNWGSAVNGPVNILRHDVGTGAGQVYFRPADGYIPAPAVGEKLYYRWYFCASTDINADRESHAIADNGSDDTDGITWNGNANLSFGFSVKAGGTWSPKAWHVDGGGNVFAWRDPELDQGTVYVVQYSVERVNSTDVRFDSVHVSLASDPTVDIGDVTAMELKDPPRTPMEDFTGFTAVNDLASFRGFAIGSESGVGSSTTDSWWDMGALAISSEGFPGPYVPGETVN